MQANMLFSRLTGFTLLLIGAECYRTDLYARSYSGTA